MLNKAFNRITGFADVEQKNDVIIISGVSASTLARDMKYIWSTSKIAGAMFIKVTWSEIRIPTFFALEFQYILRKLVESRGLYTSKRVLRNVIDALETNTWIANISVAQQPWLDRSKLSEIIYPKLLNHQAEFLDIYESTRKRYGLKGMLLAAAPGAGKAQPLYSKIRTPNGWTTMGEIQVGDLVSTPDGAYASVQSVHPQGEVDIYEFTFADGRTARACGDHLWNIVSESGVIDTVTTLEIKEDLEAYTGVGLIRYIPLTEPVSSPEIELPKDPYTAGVNSLKRNVPVIYKKGSYSQRLALLQGMMDSSGVAKDSVINYRTTDRRNAELVVYLVRSIGGIAILYEGPLGYSVNIRYSKPELLFRENFLAELARNGRYTHTCDRLGIKSVEYVGVEEAQCIMIDHPDHLYITDDYVVTHNTVTGAAVALTTGATKVIIISPMNAIHKVWQKTLNEEFKVPQHPYVFKDSPNQLQPQKKWHIFHYEAIDKAIELAKMFRDEQVCIIIDECHNFNEIKSMRTQRLLELGVVSGSRDILWMSGTPVKALGFETIPLLKSIDPYFNEVTELAFRKMFGKDAKRTLDILAYRLGLISHNVPKSEFMTEEPIYETIKVKMPHANKYTLPELSKVMNAFIEERTIYYKDHKKEFQDIYDKCIDIHRATLRTPQQVQAFKEYQQAVQFIVKNGFDNKRDVEIAVMMNKYEKNEIHPSIPQELRKPFANAKSVIKYVDLKIRGECLGRILTKERIQCHVDMLEYIPFSDLINGVKKKTLIFTNYVAVVEEARKILEKQGFKPLTVYAETNSELTATVSRFDKDPKINPLVATYDSLSTAVPLTMANGVIFLNNPWRSYIKDQAIARAWRVGQDEQVYGFDIILDTGSVPNISSRSLDIMQWSRDQVDKIMGISGGVEVSIEAYDGFLVSKAVDTNDCLDDVLTDPDFAEANVTNSVIPTPAERMHLPAQYQFYSQVGRVAMEAMDESNTVPLNNLEAGDSVIPVEMSEDWKPVVPTETTSDEPFEG